MGEKLIILGLAIVSVIPFIQWTGNVDTPFWMDCLAIATGGLLVVVGVILLVLSRIL